MSGCWSVLDTVAVAMVISAANKHENSSRAMVEEGLSDGYEERNESNSEGNGCLFIYTFRWDVRESNILFVCLHFCHHLFPTLDTPNVPRKRRRKMKKKQKKKKGDEKSGIYVDHAD